jgi:hypothetical protein
MHLAPVDFLSALFSFSALVHVHQAQLHWRMLPPSSLFFFSIDSTVDGAINGDRVKHTTSKQLLLA